MHPTPELETERLLLRELRLTDAPDIFAYASNPEIGKHTAWPPHERLADSERYLEMAIALRDDPREALWGVYHKADGRIIGTCGLYDIDAYHASAAIGYVLSLDYRGQGIMPEAMRAVVAHAFRAMGLVRLQGVCRVDNMPSTRVMEKLGMRPEGVMRQYRVVKGRRIDMKMYAVLKDDPEAAAYLDAASAVVAGPEAASRAVS